MTAESKSKIDEGIAENLAKHQSEREKIEAGAKGRGVEAPPDITAEEILEEFMRPMPRLAKWFLGNYFRKHAASRQAGFDLPIRGFVWQSRLTFFQALFLIFFIMAVAAYAWTRRTR